MHIVLIACHTSLLYWLNTSNSTINFRLLVIEVTMLKLAILLNTWQLDEWRERNIQGLRKDLAPSHFEDFIVGMDIPGVKNWGDEATFLRNLQRIAGEYDYLVIIKALNSPISSFVVQNMIKTMIFSRHDYLYFDGSEFGFGNNLRIEIIRPSAINLLISGGAKLLSDGSIDAFAKCDAGCYFPTPDDCGAYYRDFFTLLYSYPMIINIEGVSACNIQCKMCRFHGQQSSHYRKPSQPYMSQALFRKIIDEVAVYPRKPYIEMCLRGEELLAEDFLWKVRYIKDHGLHAFLVTNGQLLSRKISRSILELGLDHVVISCEGHDKDTFERIMRKGSHDRWRQNVDDLLAEKTRMGSNTWVTIKLVMQHDNLNRIDSFADYWRARPVNSFVLQNFLEFGDNGHHISRYTPRPLPWRLPCRQFFLNAAINTAGLTSPCSVHDMERNENMIGDISKDTLLDIWRGDRMNAFRTHVLEGRYEEVPFCANCQGDTCKSIVMARWNEGEWFKTVCHSVVIYQRI